MFLADDDGYRIEFQVVCIGISLSKVLIPKFE